MTAKTIEATGATLTVDGNPVGGSTGAELYSFTPGTNSRTAIEKTHLGSVANKEKQAAKLRELGDWTFVLDFDLSDTNYEDGATYTWRLTFPLESGESTAAYIEFSGFCTSQDRGPGEVDNIMRTTLTVTPDGSTYTEQAAS